MFIIEYKKPDAKEKRKEQEKLYKTLAKYTGVGYYLVTPLLVGVFLGLSIDSYLHIQPRFTIFGLILGTISTMYNLYKLVKENS